MLMWLLLLMLLVVAIVVAAVVAAVVVVAASAAPVAVCLVPPLPPRSSSPKQTVHQSLPYGGDIQAAMKNQDRAAIREIMKAKKRSADHGNASDAGSKGGAARFWEVFAALPSYACFRKQFLL